MEWLFSVMLSDRPVLSRGSYAHVCLVRLLRPSPWTRRLPDSESPEHHNHPGHRRLGLFLSLSGRLLSDYYFKCLIEFGNRFSFALVLLEDFPAHLG